MSQRKYAPTHEWVEIKDGLLVVGLSQFAVDQLTDVIYIDLPKVGVTVTSGQPVAEIESVKAVSDIYAPVEGEITEVNTVLATDASIVSRDPFGEGWLFKIKPTSADPTSRLLSEAEYQAQIAGQGH
ncbi:MAG: glycine cleavage system protein GcvH [Gemmataceae bacterium]|nr:glycine cleavage system protein GcvH [Gemmataceae bacterium]